MSPVTHTIGEHLFRRCPWPSEGWRSESRHWGPQHPDVAQSLNTLALPIFQRARSILEQVLPDHPNTAATLKNLAAFLRAMGREEQANEYDARAQAIRAWRGEAGG